MNVSQAFSRLINLTSDAVDLSVWIKPNTDLDSSFTAICDDTGETLRVNGWLFVEAD
jgi:hypothetical protein